MSTKMMFTVFASIFVMLTLTVVVSGQQNVHVSCNANANGALEKDASILVDITRILTVEANPEPFLCGPLFWGPWNCAEMYSRGTAQIKVCSRGKVLPCNEAGEYLNRVLAQCVTPGANGNVVEGEVTINKDNFLEEITYYIERKSCPSTRELSE
ncbi:hypothetical protein Mapa_009734 [Marchantia paleacea]|nr:hypothetical protein Mapa_009734 [Marchantia paleacea]